MSFLHITSLGQTFMASCQTSHISYQLEALGESKPSLKGCSAELRYLCLAALAAIFKKYTVIESHISSIKTRKIICAGASNAGAWQGLCSTGWLPNCKGDFLPQCTSLVKFSLKYDQQFSSGRVCHCWCLAEVYAPRMISNILWSLTWL